LTHGATVLLTDYRSGTLFAFDPATGIGQAAQSSGGAAVRGFGQWRTFGLFGNRQRVFTAAFLRQDSLVLSVGGTEYDLSHGDVTVKLDDLLPFVARRVRISQPGRPEFSGSYWFFRTQGWPDDGDILSLAVRIAAGGDSALGFVDVWKAHAEGRDLTSKEFLDELDTRTATRPGSDRGRH
jgi:hypothetical protein